jgi:hypothetical protein
MFGKFSAAHTIIRFDGLRQLPFWGSQKPNDRMIARYRMLIGVALHFVAVGRASRAHVILLATGV